MRRGITEAIQLGKVHDCFVVIAGLLNRFCPEILGHIHLHRRVPIVTKFAEGGNGFLVLPCLLQRCRVPIFVSGDDHLRQHNGCDDHNSDSNDGKGDVPAPLSLRGRGQFHAPLLIGASRFFFGGDTFVTRFFGFGPQFVDIPVACQFLVPKQLPRLKPFDTRIAGGIHGPDGVDVQF